MRHQYSTDRSRRRRTTTPTRASRVVRVGEKEVYDPNNAADVAEFRTVLRYRHS